MYKLSPLPYSYQELEPYIDTHTVGLHYHKHQQNYLTQLNNLLMKNNYKYNYSLTELIYHINEFPKNDQENILYNLGGVLNHELYWKSMNPNSQKPLGSLKMQIEYQYESYEKFWEQIKYNALSLKGSGYIFLVLKSDGKLDIINVSNQDTPLLLGYTPLFNIDIWEHAYYLNYKNDKNSYLDNLEKIADFTYANKIFDNLKNSNIHYKLS